MTQIVTLISQKALWIHVVLFTPDVDTINVRPMIEKGLISELGQIATQLENRGFRFLHLLDQTIEMARNTVRLLASALGTKRSALVIDDCFASVFQSCVKLRDRTADNSLVVDGLSQQLDWCGVCIFANEVRLIWINVPACIYSFNSH